MCHDLDLFRNVIGDCLHLIIVQLMQPVYLFVCSIDCIDDFVQVKIYFLAISLNYICVYCIHNNSLFYVSIQYTPYSHDAL